ncbi:hypothetical protein [Bacteroides sp.]|uniref:ADP-ribosyltransferase-containing protein n=1 Tax=Bacteroides sp. TaxID=29523 RepID=UPI002A7F2680|nr:hypothetical protein [Bacteroides sp.]
MDKTYTVFHGTPKPHITFKFLKRGRHAAYFTDDRDVAEGFAFMIDAGGLMDGEKATLLEAEITFSNPLAIPESQWEEIGDSCSIDQKKIMEQGYDGIICTNSVGCTYFVVFSYSQIRIINKTYLKEEHTYD